MNVLSLFSGIGGLDLGLERAGMTVVGQVEIDPWCRQILAKHWPEVPRHDDVRTAAEWWGGRAVDLVCGGFPCQPTSGAGKRQVEADSRWLWPAFAEVVRHLGPRYVVVENPSSGFFGPVALKDGDGRRVGYSRSPIEIVLGDLAALGYDAEWDCVPAVFVGAPHIRDRVFIVAYPGSGELRDQPGRRNGQSRPGAPVAGDDGASQPVADAQGHLRRASGNARPASSDRRSPDVANAEGQRSQLRSSATARPRRSASGARDALADATSERRSSRVFPFADVVNDRSQPAHGDAGTRRDRDWWATEPDVGRVAHGIPRRVDRLRGLGNAVVPQVAEHIGRLIMAAA